MHTSQTHTRKNILKPSRSLKNSLSATYVRHCSKHGTVHCQTALRRPAATLPAATSAAATAAVAVALHLPPNGGHPKAISALSANTIATLVRVVVAADLAFSTAFCWETTGETKVRKRIMGMEDSKAVVVVVVVVAAAVMKVEVEFVSVASC